MELKDQSQILLSHQDKIQEVVTKAWTIQMIPSIESWLESSKKQTLDLLHLILKQHSNLLFLKTSTITWILQLARMEEQDILHRSIWKIALER